MRHWDTSQSKKIQASEWLGVKEKKGGHDETVLVFHNEPHRVINVHKKDKYFKVTLEPVWGGFFNDGKTTFRDFRIDFNHNLYIADCTKTTGMLIDFDQHHGLVTILDDNMNIKYISAPPNKILAERIERLSKLLDGPLEATVTVGECMGIKEIIGVGIVPIVEDLPPLPTFSN